MCEANAYLVRNGREELFMESVDLVEPEKDDSFKMVSLFGEQKTLKARLVKMNLVEHKILFEETS